MKIVLSIMLIFGIITILPAQSISSLLTQIKTAPISEKRVLINQLKLKLRASNNKQRLDTISKLKNNQYSKHNNHSKFRKKLHIKMKTSSSNKKVKKGKNYH
jgi:hypothetical protein